MAISLGLIACSNGLGHVRRLVLIANDLTEYGASVTLFAPKVSVERIAVALQIKIKFVFIDFDTQTSADLLRIGNYQSLFWEERLPNLSNFDFVVSDNLPEILAIRPDAWLSGNFLWHETLRDISPQYRRRATQLIQSNRPNMLIYTPFSSILETSDLKLHECIMPQAVKIFPNLKQDSLLITSGTGGEIAPSYKRFVESLVHQGRGPFATLFVEPDLLPEIKPSWMVAAEFNANMFSRSLAAICRPGMGIVSDCIQSSIKMFLVFERGNLEMKSNANSLESHGIGSTFNSCQAAFKAAENWVYDGEFEKFDNLFTSSTTTKSVAHTLLG